METSSVWNNNELHFTLSSTQKDDSIHNLNSKASFTDNRKPTHSNFPSLYSPALSPVLARISSTSNTPSLFQLFSLTERLNKSSFLELFERIQFFSSGLLSAILSYLLVPLFLPFVVLPLYINI